VIILRPYQEQALAAIVRGFEDHRRLLLVQPTGSGKTAVLARIAEHFQPERTLVLAHRWERRRHPQ
jgi:superfamily II DNA or RNA helicase